MKSFLLENSKERVFPFLIIGTFYSVLIYFIHLTPQFNDVILIVMSCVTVAILLVAIISNFWKVSAHAVGVSGMIALLAAINNKIPDSTLFYPLTIMIVLAGCLMSARLYLNAHNPSQILGGTVLGLLVGGFSYIFL